MRVILYRVYFVETFWCGLGLERSDPFFLKAMDWSDINLIEYTELSYNLITMQYLDRTFLGGAFDYQVAHIPKPSSQPIG